MPRKLSTTPTPDTADEMQEALGAQPPQTDPDDAGAAAEAPGIQGDNPTDQADSQTEMETPEADENSAGLQDEPSKNASDSQTEPDSDGNLADGHEPNPENSGIPHTDIESGSDEGTYSSPAGTPAPVESPDDASHHTGTEINENEPGSAAQGPLQPDTPPFSQTGSETDENLADLAEPAEESSIKTPVSQTDPDAAPPEVKKTRRRSVKSQSGEDSEPASQTGTGTTAPARRRRAQSNPVLAIDDERTVETSEDKLRNDLLDLVESQKGKKILSGAIQGVERSADNSNLSFAVIYHGAFKVIIPAEETVQPPEDFRDRSPADVMHYLVTKRLGAEIDYIVKGVDINSGIAAASRLEAMALKRRQYYFGTDRDGNNLIYEGISAEARVVSVIRAGVFVDLFGLEIYIPLRELSYQRWIDASAHFQAGQRVLVKILKLDRSDRNNIRVSASVKQAGENPYEQALKKYSPGSRYVGTVSLVDTNGVFVSLDGGIDCLCSYPKRGRPPRGARVTVRIIGVNHETNRIWGAITHMTTAR